MSTQQLLSIGYIPLNHGGGTISCGDPDGSGSKELTLLISEDLMITCMEDSLFSYDANKSNWFSAKDKLWDALATLINANLKPKTLLDEFTLASTWAIIMDEPLKKSKISLLDSDFGEFFCDSRFNDRFYFRYQLIEDEEVTTDQIYTNADL